jgi:RNA polymerase sigma-70 factor (ECF subfamily)
VDRAAASLSAICLVTYRCEALGFSQVERIQAMHVDAAMTGIPVATSDTPTPDDVINRYWPKAFRFAAMVAPSDQDSRDIAQEALLLVIKRFDTFDLAKGPFEAWLWRIVINVAKDAGRASLRRASLFDRLTRDTRSEVPADVESIALLHMSDTQLLQLVRKLNPRRRTLLALRFGAQLSYPEIATQLGMTDAAAIMATRRALATLRHKLEDVT